MIWAVRQLCLNEIPSLSDPRLEPSYAVLVGCHLQEWGLILDPKQEGKRLFQTKKKGTKGFSQL